MRDKHHMMGDNDMTEINHLSPWQQHIKYSCMVHTKPSCTYTVAIAQSHGSLTVRVMDSWSKSLESDSCICPCEDMLDKPHSTHVFPRHPLMPLYKIGLFNERCIYYTVTLRKWGQPPWTYETVWTVCNHYPNLHVSHSCLVLHAKRMVGCFFT